MTLTISVQLPLAGIVRPAGSVTLDPPGVANGAPVPPQVVLTLGTAAIVTPAGKLSISGAVSVLGAAWGLVIVMVRVETPPALIELGAKALLIDGTTNCVISSVAVAGARLLPLLVCSAPIGMMLI